MLERQIMFKQLQELQRQKKLQELNDACQQNVMHNKHSSVTQYGPLNNGVPVRDASQMFMFGDTNLVHGLPNRLGQNQVLQSMGHLAHFQGPVLSQGLQIAGQTRKPQKVKHHDRYKELGGVEESGMEYVSGNRDLATLDPLMEQKILFNAEDNSMKNMFEKTDNSSDCGSLQSGSWSALMQSAVAEVSNGDSGVKEEWSGLSFQNPELSNEKQPSSMVESGKHQTQWLYNNGDHSGMSGFMDRSAVLVKKEDCEKWSTIEVKPGMGQQVASSRRQPSIWVDVPIKQNPPSTSYAANRKMETGFGKSSSKMQQRGNHGPAVSPGDLEAFGRSLKKAAPMVKKERVDYDNKVPLHSACGNYKSQPISSSSATDLSVKASIDQCWSVGPVTGTNEVALTRSSSVYLKQYDVAKDNMVVSKSKKRKVSTFERLPWHKEVTESCSRLHDMSAELEWAHSVNRIPEKAADSLLIVDRKRRRLILTTQLMQLLFHPAPKVVLSEDDATKHCDTITYYVAKFGLSDACRPFKSISDNDLLRIVQGFIDRSKRMEDMLSRFEKGESSILDVKVEFQDLDKFSVINRFAKFHSRGPLVTTDTSSSGGASAMQKLNPQRYVTASEMPSIVPEGRYCLSL